MKDDITNIKKSLGGDSHNDIINNSKDECSIDKPIKVKNIALNTLVNSLKPTSKQGRRTVFYLGHNPDSKTGDVIHYAGVNISHVSRKCNKFLRPQGYEIRCRKPPKPILNRFGDVSEQHLWGIYKIGGDK